MKHLKLLLCIIPIFFILFFIPHAEATTTGYVELNGTTFYLQNDKRVKEGWSENKDIYFDKKNGCVLNGWQHIKEKNENGDMIGDYYYFNEEDGKKLENGTYNLDGFNYTFDIEGHLISEPYLLWEGEYASLKEGVKAGTRVGANRKLADIENGWYTIKTSKLNGTNFVEDKNLTDTNTSKQIEKFYIKRIGYYQYKLFAKNKNGEVYAYNNELKLEPVKDSESQTWHITTTSKGFTLSTKEKGYVLINGKEIGPVPNTHKDYPKMMTLYTDLLKQSVQITKTTGENINTDIYTYNNTERTGVGERNVKNAYELKKSGGMYQLIKNGKIVQEGPKIFMSTFFSTDVCAAQHRMITLNGHDFVDIPNTYSYGMRDASLIVKNGIFYYSSFGGSQKMEVDGEKFKNQKVGRFLWTITPDFNSYIRYNPAYKNITTYKSVDIDYQRIWAPEVFKDNDKIYVYYSTSVSKRTGKNGNNLFNETNGNEMKNKNKADIAVTQATDINAGTFSDAKAVLYDSYPANDYPSNSNGETVALKSDGIFETNTDERSFIDAQVVKVGNEYIMVTKQENAVISSRYDRILIYKTTNLNGTWKYFSQVSGLPHFDDKIGIETIGHAYEAPCLAYINNEYHLYVDHYFDAKTYFRTYDGEIYHLTSKDLKTWEFKGNINVENKPVRHGSVVEIDDEKAINKIMELFNKKNNTLKTGYYALSPKNRPTDRLTANNQNLKLKTASNKSEQKFHIQELNDGSYKIGTGFTGGVSALEGDLSQKRWNNGANSQRWTIAQSGDYYTIKNKATGKFLSFSGNTLIVNSTSSLWRFQPCSDKYTISFKDADGGVIKRVSIKKGETATAPSNPTKTGYDFTGWDKSFTNVASNLTINPKWEAKKVKLIFNRNSTSSDTVTYTDTYTYDVPNQSFGMRLANKSGQFGTWTKAGYDLLGWSFDKTAKEKTYSIYSRITNNWINKNAGTVNLYGVWQRNNNTLLHFDSNGADNHEWVLGDIEIKEARNLKLNSKWIKKNYIQTGYILGSTKYLMNDNSLYGTKDFPSKEETLKALWEPCMARFIYNGNGSTKTNGTTTYYDKKTHKIKDNMFTKDGYTFIGWNTKADGTRTSYKAGDILTGFDAEIIVSTVDANGVVQEKSKIFRPDWGKTKLDQEQMYVQGGDYFVRNGKEYLIGTWVGMSEEYDHHLVVIFDYKTGDVLAQATENDLGKHIGHCNGVAYSPDTDSLFIGLSDNKCPQAYKDFPMQNKYSTYLKKTESHYVNLIELKWDGNKKISIEKGHVLTKDWGTTNVLGNIVSVDYYKGVYHIRHGAAIYEYIYDKNKKEFVHLRRYKDKNGEMLKNETGGGFGGKELIENPLSYTGQTPSGQGWAYNGYAYATGGFYGNSANSFVSYIFPLTKTDSAYKTNYTSPVTKKQIAEIQGLEVISPIRFSVGPLNIARSQYKTKEIQDFSYDDAGNLYILCCRWGLDKEGDKKEDGKTVKTENSLSVLKCRGSGIPTTTLYAQWKK